MMASLLYAENCEVKSYRALGLMYPATEINLFEEYRLDLSHMSAMEPNVKNYSTNDAYWAYRAKADSSIMVYVLEDGLKFFKICSSKEECDQKVKDFLIRNVIVDEFKRLQKAGVFKGTANEADSLINHIADVIENAPFSSEVYDSKSYNITRQNVDQAEMILPRSSFCSNTGGKFDGNICGVMDTVSQCQLLPNETQGLFSHGRNTSQGRECRIFNLNGKFIRDDFWQDDGPRNRKKDRTPTAIQFK